DLCGLVQETTGVEAEVENETLDASLTELPHELLEVVGRAFLKAAQADVADLVFGIDDVVPLIIGAPLDAQDGLQLDRPANELELQGFGFAFAFDDDFYLGAGFTFDLVDSVLDAHALGRDDLRRGQR